MDLHRVRFGGDVTTANEEAGTGFILMRFCLVKIPYFGGTREYGVEAGSLFDAARRAMAQHEPRHGKLPDEVVMLVIQDGKTYMQFDATNTTRRNHSGA